MIEDGPGYCDPDCPSCQLRRVLGLLREDRSRSYSEEVVPGLTFGDLLAAVERSQTFTEHLLDELDAAHEELDTVYSTAIGDDRGYIDDDDDDDDDDGDFGYYDGEG